MARYDKYDPNDGGFRAKLAADLASTEGTGNGNPIAVGLNTDGAVVAGAGNSGIVGVLCTTRDMKAGDVVDVMKDGEIVELAGVTAGTAVTGLTTTGVLGTTAADATHIHLGHSVEASRLVVGVSR